MTIRTHIALRRLAAAAALGSCILGMESFLPMFGDAWAASIVHPADRILNLGVNRGTLIKLDRPANNIFIANPEIADVQVKSPTLLYVFGTAQGETTLYAVGADDNVVFSATIAVAQNMSQIENMLRMVAPDTDVQAAFMSGMVVLSGYVEKPEQADEITRLAQTLVGKGQEVVNRLQIATPTQVNLRVKFVEVSRDTLKTLGVAWEGFWSGSDASVGLFTARNVFDLVPNPAASVPGVIPGTVPPLIRQFDTFTGGADTIVGSITSGNFDVSAAIDALESEGFVSILAEPNLTAISGETATFLAGGEFPIPIPDVRTNAVVVEFKEFGVGLAFTPTVMGKDRISLRVRPEVSQLSADGAVSVNGISVPALTTRRAETTVELGSGQSFAIAGLLQNNVTQNVRKLPGLGNLPIIGALFKSDRFRNQETELVIIVTPYLVKPTQLRRLATPLDGKVNPTDMDRYLRGETFRPQPAAAPRPLVDNPDGQVAGPVGFTLSN
ncbi:MAG: type II and III secretion system protein family protein [Alphaproteobacteria bacterium]|nr:MAG: type II and III secretion system protein family protein [Alphaproteobacteria bacterium]